MRIKILLSLLLSSIILIFFLFFNIDGIRSYLKKNLSHETKIYIKKIFFGEEYLNEVDWKNNISHQNDGRFAKRLLQWIKDEKIKEITFATSTQYKEDYLPRFTKSSNT